MEENNEIINENSKMEESNENNGKVKGNNEMISKMEHDMEDDNEEIIVQIHQDVELEDISWSLVDQFNEAFDLEIKKE